MPGVSWAMSPAQTDGPDLPVCVISFRSLPARVLIWSSALNCPPAMKGMASISRTSTVSSGAWPIQFHPTRSTTSSTGSWGSPV
eukprot:scaffold91809_cov48-Phaeocystis_antarctica.AAC.1